MRDGWGERLRRKGTERRELLCRRGWLALCLLAASFGAASGRVIHVPADFAEIQDAIDNANNGDEIIVGPGHYQSFTIFQDIVVRSTFDGDWSVVRNTTIDGDVYFEDFYHKQNENCILRGFTIKGEYGGVFSALFDGVGTHATIEYNIITNNSSGFLYEGSPSIGGGISNCDGLIQNNILEDNIAYFGGALYQCQGTIQNNVIRHNRSLILNYYYSSELYVGYKVGDGGAMYECNGLIRNNTIVDNFREFGVVNSYEDHDGPLGSRVIHYYVTNHAWQSGGLVNCKGTLVNNIIYQTTMTLPVLLDGSTSPTYCLFRTPRSGVGNIAGDPLFVDSGAGDYHLKPGSPCSGRGQAIPDFLFDFDGARRGGGAGYAIGAFEPRTAPVAVWLPGGVPAGLRNGNALAVSWVLTTPADTALRLRLYAGPKYFFDLGLYSALSASAHPVALPPFLDTRTDYFIRAVSLANGQGVSYVDETPPFTIIGTPKNGVKDGDWMHY